MKHAHLPKTLIVIPVYNHGAALRAVVEQALAQNFAVLVVDDGSKEDVAPLLAGLPCRIHRLPENRGKGAAILEGAIVAEELGYEAMLTIDADGQHDPADAPKLLQALNGQWPAMVIGNRRMGENVPRASLFGRAFSNFWVRLETGLRLEDTQSGMRLYPVRELRQLKLRKQRYDFEIEVLVRGAWAGIPILSTAISVHYPTPEKRVSHFDMRLDNLRLSLLHTMLVIRSLLPLPHKKLVKPRDPEIGAGLLLHPVRFFKMLVREHTSPVLVAAAVWLGVFLGALPLLACHTIAIIYVAHKLHLNKVIAVAASQICMPPLVPALCIELGYFMRHGSWLIDISKQTLISEIDQRLLEYLLGSLVIGPLLGFMVAGMVYVIHVNLKPGIASQ